MTIYKFIAKDYFEETKALNCEFLDECKKKYNTVASNILAPFLRIKCSKVSVVQMK